MVNYLELIGLTYLNLLELNHMINIDFFLFNFLMPLFYFLKFANSKYEIVTNNSSVQEVTAEKGQTFSLWSM